MSCPYCGGALEEGFLQSSHRIAFVKQPRWLGIRTSQGDRNLPFSPLRGAFFPAHFCTHCQKINISLEKET